MKIVTRNSIYLFNDDSGMLSGGKIEELFKKKSVKAKPFRCEKGTTAIFHIDEPDDPDLKDKALSTSMVLDVIIG